jgi:hypothetical protein
MLDIQCDCKTHGLYLYLCKLADEYGWKCLSIGTYTEKMKIFCLTNRNGETGYLGLYHLWLRLTTQHVSIENMIQYIVDGPPKSITPIRLQYLVGMSASVKQEGGFISRDNESLSRGYFISIDNGELAYLYNDGKWREMADITKNADGDDITAFWPTQTDAERFLDEWSKQ